MTGHKPFSDLTRNLTPARRARVAAKAAALPATLEDTLAGAVLWAAYQRLNLSEIDRIHLRSTELKFMREDQEFHCRLIW